MDASSWNPVRDCFPSDEGIPPPTRCSYEEAMRMIEAALEVKRVLKQQLCSMRLRLSELNTEDSHPHELSVTP